MPTRNISLTEHFDRFVEDSIESGHYLNASEVVRDALRLLQQRNQEEALKLNRLREAAKIGFDAIDRGEFRELHEGNLEEAISSISRVAGQRAKRANH